MDCLKINGGRKLYGEIRVNSAKNAVLPIIAASILSQEQIIIKDVPDIVDVDKMLNILVAMGGSIRKEEDTRIINNNPLSNFEIPGAMAKEIRSSIFMLGPLLAKYKKARVAYPGGCDIGSRPIDLHLSGLKELNVKIEENYGFIDCDGSKMKSGLIHLDFPSVGATENIMMAAVFLKGETVILNSAKEPEIVDLANFINKMGGKIKGAGTSTVRITGVKKLKGVEYSCIPDRIIAGTYLIAGCMAGGKIRLTNVNYEHIFALITKIRNSGCKIEYDSDNIYLESNFRPIACPSIETSPYPGFATDLQAQMLAQQTISDGISVITENLFETRFKHVPELIKMGAKVVVRDRMAIIRGVPTLYGAEVVAHDLRGGAALILAGLSAKGTTIVQGAHFVDRGYDNIEEKFNMLGADISRF